MKKTLLLFLTIPLFLVFFGVEQVKAGPEHNVSGWAWSSNIGWISFSCTNLDTCATVDYGVNIDPATGNFSGYAWSANIGWIDFAPAGPYPAAPNYSARVDLTTGEVSGWARGRFVCMPSTVRYTKDWQSRAMRIILRCQMVGSPVAVVVFKANIHFLHGEFLCLRHTRLLEQKSHCLVGSDIRAPS